MRLDTAESTGGTRNGTTQHFGRRLSDLLLSEGLLTPEQLGQAMAEQLTTDDKLVDVLARLGMIGEDDLLQFLSRTYAAPVVELPDTIEPEIRALVPGPLARKYEVVPVSRTPSALTLALIDPTNLSAVDEVSFRTGLRVIPVLARPSAIRRHLRQAYERGADTLTDALTLAEADAAQLERANGQEPELHRLRASADQAPIVRLVNAVFEDAVRRGASDIHLDPTETALRIRFRVDGMLAEVTSVPKRVEPAVVSRIKIVANLDISERRLPQDGRIKFRQHGRDIDFRVSVLPTVHGESVALRVLDKDALRRDPRRLGFDDWGLMQFERAIRSAHGLILITGPTGAGKTTTLYSAIHALDSPDVHIVTLEDPVEYDLKGINQVQVREELGFTFAGALRSFLRHDPDVILVGEMRDAETAQMAVRGALTGHLVLSSLHTTDSPSCVARLVDMGVPPFLIASALRLVVAQRLVRKICLDCREPVEVPEARLAAFGHVPGTPGPLVLYAGKGCAACGFTGVRGRVAIYEVMPVTPEIGEMVLAGSSTAEIRRVARDQGMRTLREAGLALALDGATTLEEVLRVTSD